MYTNKCMDFVQSTLCLLYERVRRLFFASTVVKHQFFRRHCCSSSCYFSTWMRCASTDAMNVRLWVWLSNCDARDLLRCLWTTMTIWINIFLWSKEQQRKKSHTPNTLFEFNWKKRFAVSMVDGYCTCRRAFRTKQNTKLCMRVSTSLSLALQFYHTKYSVDVDCNFTIL